MKGLSHSSEIKLLSYLCCRRRRISSSGSAYEEGDRHSRSFGSSKPSRRTSQQQQDEDDDEGPDRPLSRHHAFSSSVSSSTPSSDREDTHCSYHDNRVLEILKGKHRLEYVNKPIGAPPRIPTLWPSPSPSSSLSFSYLDDEDYQNHRCSARTATSWPSSVASSSLSFSYSDNGEYWNQTSHARIHNTISVFWDLDNKPPASVPPYDAAVRLREVALGFGQLVDMVAYANRHAFSYLPTWVRDERRQRKELDRLEVSGLVVPGEPYVCSYCGRKCKTNVALKKHFKELHERERTKRLRRLDHLKGKKKLKYKQSLAEKETRYRDAARYIIHPKVGYGLMSELKRAGVVVKMVSDQPQAADQALMEHMSQSINKGIKCICLVSDDSDFLPILHEARQSHLHTVVVGDRTRLKTYADVQFSWADLASGQAFDRAAELAAMWYGRNKSSHAEYSSPEKAGSKEREHFPVRAHDSHSRAHDFQEWDVSDNSDNEYAMAENVDVSELESCSDAWFSEDDNEDKDDDDDNDG